MFYRAAYHLSIMVSGFLLDKKLRFLSNKKRSAKDAHSRDLKHVANATALGASVSQARNFYMHKWRKRKTHLI